MPDDMRQMQLKLAAILGLRNSESQTMWAIARECAATKGAAMGAAGAVGMAGAGAVMVPGIGSVPGWLAGFAAGWVAGTFMCTVATRTLVIEALKDSIEFSGMSRPDEATALAMLRGELFRMTTPATPQRMTRA